MKWKEGRIDGVVVKPLAVNKDKRGRLVEVWRADWCAECRSSNIKFVEEPAIGPRMDRWECKDCGAVVSLGGPKNNAVMSYLSYTNKDVIRGPHEHVEQTDVFCFMNRFAVRLWDSRKKSTTKGKRMTLIVRAPVMVVVPPGIVHAYMSLDDNGLVVNMPDRLYAGVGKSEPVDEIRHENKKRSPYTMEDWLSSMRLSGRLVPVPTNFEVASQSKVEMYQKNIDKLLKLLGHPEALVTDESTVEDFIPMTDNGQSILRRVQKGINDFVYRNEKLVDVAGRMK